MSIDRAAPSEFGRKRPILLLLICSVAVILHDMNFASTGDVYPAALLFFATFGALSAVGCMYPAVFFAIGKYGKHLSVWYKLAAAATWLGGFALGMYALLTMY